MNGLLTDEEVSKAHSKAIDDIASLIDGITGQLIADNSNKAPTDDTDDGIISDEKRKEREKRKEKADTMGEEILGLVSKILAHRGSVETIAKDAKGGESCSKDKKFTMDAAATRGTKSIIDAATSVIDDASRQESRLSSVVSQVGRGLDPTNHDRESFSVCTVTSHSDDDDESYEEESYIVNASSNSLFDGTGPTSSAGRRRSAIDEDDDDTLEIVYEYYTDSDNEERSACFPRRRSSLRSSASSSAYHNYEDDDDYSDGRSYHGDETTYSCDGDEESNEYTPDEDVEYPPQGYHRYSPTSQSCNSGSRYSSSRASTSHSRH